MQILILSLLALLALEERKVVAVDDNVENDLLSSSTSSIRDLDSMDLWEEDEVVSLFEEEEGLL